MAKFYYYKEGKKAGPFDQEDIVTLAKKGLIKKYFTIVTEDGYKTKAEDIKWLSFLKSPFINNFFTILCSVLLALSLIIGIGIAIDFGIRIAIVFLCACLSFLFCLLIIAFCIKIISLLVDIFDFMSYNINQSS